MADSENRSNPLGNVSLSELLVNDLLKSEQKTIFDILDMMSVKVMVVLRLLVCDVTGHL